MPLSESGSAPTLFARRAVVVLGMHRSGTSAVAGSLHRLGVDFGPRLMPATVDNPRGYYEHIDVVNLHDRLLLVLGASWDETVTLPFGGSWIDDPNGEPYREEMLSVLRRDFGSGVGTWGVKDPRLCRLLPWWEPLWLQLESRPLFVHVVRPVRQVAASLARREGFSAGKSYLLWLLYVLEAERSTRGHERVFIDFDLFVDQPWETLAPIRRALGPAWPAAAAERFADLGPFVDPLLRQFRADDSAGEPPPVWVAAAEAACRQLFSGGDFAWAEAEFDRLHSQVGAAAELFAVCGDGASNDLRHQLEVSRQQARWYEEEWRKARSRADTTRVQLETKRVELSRMRDVLQRRRGEGP